jgi:DNA uptake protein ComE-like DNA-binding protein
MKKWLQDYFKLSNREWNGFMVLLGILLSIQAFLTYQFYNAPKPELTLITTADDKLRESNSDEEQALREREYFYPNHPSQEELSSHQLPSRLVKNWLNYVNKGGRFKSLPDIKKLYGMNDSLYAYLLPYLLEEKQEPKYQGEKRETRAKPYRFRTDTARVDDYRQLHIPVWLAERIHKYGAKRDGFSSPEELFKVYGFDSSFVDAVVPYLIFNEHVEREAKPSQSLVNLNLADSLALIEVKGIGPAFASRILKYRTRLGGFVYKEQLMEVYGIDAERYPPIAAQVEVTDTLVTRINVNTADFSTLVKHPYISKELTLLIINFREEIRDFKNVDEVFQLGLMTQEEFHKLAPYLVVK